MDMTIYSNDVTEMYDALKKELEAGTLEDGEDMDEDTLWDKAYEYVEEYLEDEILNLDKAPGGEIILIGTLQRWNGAYKVHKNLGTDNIGKAIPRAFGCFGGDNTFKVYIEDGRMYLSQYGHDNPVSPSIMEFRVLNKGVDYDELEVGEIEANSFSPAPTVAEVYGWDLAA